MKALINHIKPRSGTKRAAALQKRAVEILHKRLLEHGAVDRERLNDYTKQLPLFMRLETDFGPLDFTIHSKEDSATFALFSAFDGTEEQTKDAGALLGSNPYSGKWNHFAALEYNQMENLLGYLARMLPRIAVNKKPPLLSEPRY